MNRHYSTLMDLAKTGVADSLARTLKAFNQVNRPWPGCSVSTVPISPLASSPARTPSEQYQPLLYWMVNFLGDSQASPSGANAPRGGIHRLIPALVEVNSHDAWADLLLVAALPTPAHEQRFKSVIQTLIQPRGDLKEGSILNVFLKVVSKNDFKDVLRLVQGLKKFVEDPDPLLAPALKALRQAFYVNDVHPFLEIGRESFAQASKDKVIYEALFKLSSLPEFLESLRLLSSMGKNGDLQKIVADSISLFHKFAEEAKGQVDIRQGFLPSQLVLRHNLVAEDLTESNLGEITEQNTDWYRTDCDALDLNFSLHQTDSKNFDTQMDHMIGCLGARSGKSDVTEALSLLRTHQPDLGQSFFKYQINQIKKVMTSEDAPLNKLNPAETKYLLDRLMASIDDGRVFNLLDAFAFWVAPKDPASTKFKIFQNRVGPNLLTEASPNNEVMKLGVGRLLEPLLDVTRAIVSKSDHERKSLQALEDYGAEVLASDDFPKFLKDMDDLLKTDFKVASNSFSQVESLTESPDLPMHALKGFDRKAIEDFIREKECGGLPVSFRRREEQVERRTQELLHEARTNVTNWDLVYNPSQKQGVPRESWQFEELEVMLKPLFERFSVREQKVPARTAVQGFFNALAYFTKFEGSQNSNQISSNFNSNVIPKVIPLYEPEELLRWVYKRSTDYRLITYFYPNETLPRARLVNSLDLLELTLVNVDFLAPPQRKNMGLVFLSELADAWGDEDYQNWPEEIKEQFPLGGKKKPATMKEAVEGIIKRKGALGLDLEDLQTLIDKYIGVPELPACMLDPLYGKNNPPLGWASDLMVKLSSESKAEIQRKLYNLSQVQVVLREMVDPKLEAEKDPGMRVLRNLFFEMRYSTPKKYRTPHSGEKNHLSVVLRTVRLGLLRQIGRSIQNFKQDDPALKDFFQTLIRTSSAPEWIRLMEAFFSVDPEHAFKWKVMKEVFDVIDSKEPSDLAHMKQMLFYAVAASNRLDPWRPKGSPENPCSYKSYSYKSH
ncbi:unnamed protein product [Sphagnum tenellum]